jgi:muconate cycloisomerase
MLLNTVKIHRIVLPFLREFSHSLRKRISANNVVVEIIADDGTIRGYGEGAPRSYVTGESQESAVKSIRRFTQRNTFPWELNDLDQIWEFVDGLPDGKAHNAAICAIEIALLDALGRREDKSIIQYFPMDFFTPQVNYGTVLPLTHKKKVMEICELIKRMGINRLRLKMGKNFEQNREAIETAKTILGDDCDLRIDVNGAWDRDLSLRHVQLIKDHNVRIVEQPMMRGNPHIADFARMMQAAGVIVMADESACSLRDVERISKEGYYEMVNVRLSKCGGFRRSLGIIEYLRGNGLSFQIGCQLGESGLLSAAGRILSLLCRDALYYDGSYDDYLLKENITAENVNFGPGGEAGPLNGPGLGVEVDRQSLRRLNDGGLIPTVFRP